MPSILLVDDEEDILEFLEYNLSSEGYKILTAANGKEALEKLSENPDIIILDIMMPEMNGYQVCREIRKIDSCKYIPVIFLSAKSSEVDEIKGLECGADDFLRKPISTDKLIARVKANLRKNPSFSQNDNDKIVVLGPLEINRRKFRVKLDGEAIIFPKKEFEILHFLANYPGKVFSRQDILDEVWGGDVFVVDRTVDVHVRKIREKLGRHAGLIQTVKGVGYYCKETDENI